MSNTHTTPDKCFEFGWISSPKELIGKMTPFRQCWHVQFLGDGTQEFCFTRREVFEFIESFYEIADTPKPDWLLKELA